MEVLAALIPSAGVAFLFYLAIRAIIGADRKERAAIARLNATERVNETKSEARPDSVRRPPGESMESRPHAD